MASSSEQLPSRSSTNSTHNGVEKSGSELLESSNNEKAGSEQLPDS